jgi:hypothetical protein
VLNKGLSFIPSNYLPLNKQLKIHKNEIATLKINPKEKNQINQLLHDLYSYPNQNPNLTLTELNYIRKLKHNSSIIIKPADKNVGTAVIDKQLYLDLCLSHLNDPTYYKKLASHPLAATVKKLNALLDHLHSTKQISDKLRDRLRPDDDCELGAFYGLPKLHKPKLDIRPIISNVKHPTKNCSGWLHDVMQPTVLRAKSYLRNSSDLIDLINQLQPTRHTFIITADIESMYPNIPNRLGVECCTRQLEQDHLNLKRPQNLNVFRSILHNTLVNNVFELNNDYYIQINGTAMGTKSGPDYANLTLKDMEENRSDINERFKSNVLLSKRYLDDLLTIYDNHNDSMAAYIKRLRETYAPLKLNVTYGKSQNFLDLNISIDLLMDRFTVQLYRKPVAPQRLLDPSSTHPQHTINNILDQEVARIARSCTEKKNSFFHFSKLMSCGLAQKYKTRQFKKAIMPKLKNPSLEKEKMINIKMTFNPNSGKICKHLKTNTVFFSNKKVRTISLTLPNLQKILVRARLTRNQPTQP